MVQANLKREQTVYTCTEREWSLCRHKRTAKQWKPVDTKQHSKIHGVMHRLASKQYNKVESSERKPADCAKDKNRWRECKSMYSANVNDGNSTSWFPLYVATVDCNGTGRHYHFNSALRIGAFSWLVCLSSLVPDILVYCARFYVMYGILLFLFLLIVIVCILCAAFVAQ